LCPLGTRSDESGLAISLSVIVRFVWQSATRPRALLSVNVTPYIPLRMRTRTRMSMLSAAGCEVLENATVPDLSL
jgi:hypothetical protein